MRQSGKIMKMAPNVIFKKKIMNHTSEIIEDWFLALRSNNVGVQPKATTLLKNILDRYEITPKVINVWNEFLSVDVTEFDTWYTGLTSDQKAEFNLMRDRAKTMQGPGFVNGKELLKG